jgi:crotonobetainyl-CoA:carnitine CoA-transferase CaiB-like acyl-CoA transferase
MPQADLIAEVSAVIGARPLAEWEALLSGVDCCFQAVLDPAQVPGDPQIQARGLVRREPGPEPRVEVLFPAIFDGRPPEGRPALRELAATDLLSAWGAD